MYTNAKQTKENKSTSDVLTTRIRHIQSRRKWVFILFLTIQSLALSAKSIEAESEQDCNRLGPRLNTERIKLDR